MKKIFIKSDKPLTYSTINHPWTLEPVITSSSSNTPSSTPKSIIFGCDLDEFLCLNGNCIKQNLICDDNNDCEDGSDESFSICQNKFDDILRKTNVRSYMDDGYVFFLHFKNEKEKLN